MRPLLVPLLLIALAACGEGAAPSADPTPQGLRQPCPVEFEVGVPSPWVPSPPDTQTEGRLVPDADPVDAVVCRYTPEGALEGAVELTDGLDRIRHDLLVPEKLADQERVCTLAGGPQVPHLMRLSYADGDLWLSAVQDVNSCRETGNGAFVSPAYLGGRFAQAYETTAWPPAPEPKGCGGSGTGRAGQEEELVPPGWESLVVCSGSDVARDVQPETAQRVAELLGELDAQPGSNSCTGTAPTTYHLLFRYPQGPPVAIWFAPGCEPPVHNGSLDAPADADRSAELQELLDAG